MGQQKSIPRKDVDFDVAQNIIVTTANSHRMDWMLDAVWMDSELMPPKNDWDVAWANYIDPATRTSTITFIKNEKRVAFEKPLRKFVKNLQGNTHVTDDDLRSMGIVVPTSARRPAPVAVTYPDYDINSGTIRRLILNFYDQGHKRSKAKPAGQHGVEIRWVMRDTPPSSLKDLTESTFNTRSPLTLDFDESDRGKTVYFCLCWENTRGEKGPRSEITGAIIP
ncbi:MAG: hypothetical protein LBL04_08650 [Bacteroidales bacterium]|jgi:hypothetical protein|nr:hypothetical protein [Bacteroidales bacterium]